MKRSWDEVVTSHSCNIMDLKKGGRTCIDLEPVFGEPDAIRGFGLVADSESSLLSENFRVQSEIQFPSDVENNHPVEGVIDLDAESQDSQKTLIMGVDTQPVEVKDLVTEKNTNTEQPAAGLQNKQVAEVLALPAAAPAGQSHDLDMNHLDSVEREPENANSFDSDGISSDEGNSIGLHEDDDCVCHSFGRCSICGKDQREGPSMVPFPYAFVIQQTCGNCNAWGWCPFCGKNLRRGEIHDPVGAMHAA